MQPEERRVVAFDTETHLIAAGRIAPPIVCLSYAFRQDGVLQAAVIGRADGDDLRTLCHELLSDTSLILCAHNAAFDMAVIGQAFPELLPLIFQAYQDERVRDTLVREKLWQLSSHGQFEFAPSPDGSQVRRTYDLASLERLYLGRDRSALKDAEDGWRLNYAVLESVPTSKWPADALAYSREDALGTLEVYEAQQARFNASGPGSICGEEIHVYADFCLFLMTCRGIAVDAQAHQKMRLALEAEISYERLSALIEADILVPERAPAPRLVEKVVAHWDVVNTPAWTCARSLPARGARSASRTSRKRTPGCPRSRSSTSRTWRTRRQGSWDPSITSCRTRVSKRPTRPSQRCWRCDGK